MEISNKKIKITYNNGDVKYFTIGEISRGLHKTLSYLISYELEIEKEAQKELLREVSHKVFECLDPEFGFNGIKWEEYINKKIEEFNNQ